MPALTSAADLATWIAGGAYKTWHCEPAAHAPRSPSPHGTQNRICSNDKVSSHGAGEFPVGAASVKELSDGASIVGYAVGVHHQAGASESAWFWYEKSGDTVGVFAPGDTAGTAKTVCSGCHAGAGSDDKHSGHDFVYTQVR